MKQRMMQVADFIFDIDDHDVDLINQCVQDYFDNATGGKLKFTYEKTPDGYRYEIIRNLPYGYKGKFVIDIDCMVLTGLSLEDFRVNPLKPDHVPVLAGIPGRCTDGFYISTSQVEKLYKTMVSVGDDLEEPKKVKIHASDGSLSIEVDY